MFFVVFVMILFICHNTIFSCIEYRKYLLTQIDFEKLFPKPLEANASKSMGFEYLERKLEAGWQAG